MGRKLEEEVNDLKKFVLLVERWTVEDTRRLTSRAKFTQESIRKKISDFILNNANGRIMPPTPISPLGPRGNQGVNWKGRVELKSQEYYDDQVPPLFVLQGSADINVRGEKISIRIGLTWPEPGALWMCFPEKEPPGGIHEFYGDLQCDLRFMKSSTIVAIERRVDFEAGNGYCNFSVNASAEEHLQCEGQSYYDENFITPDDEEWEQLDCCFTIAGKSGKLAQSILLDMELWSKPSEDAVDAQPLPVAASTPILEEHVDDGNFYAAKKSLTNLKESAPSSEPDESVPVLTEKQSDQAQEDVQELVKKLSKPAETAYTKWTKGKYTELWKYNAVINVELLHFAYRAKMPQLIEHVLGNFQLIREEDLTDDVVAEVLATAVIFEIHKPEFLKRLAFSIMNRKC